MLDLQWPWHENRAYICSTGRTCFYDPSGPVVSLLALKIAKKWAFPFPKGAENLPGAVGVQIGCSLLPRIGGWGALRGGGEA